MTAAQQLSRRSDPAPSAEAARGLVATGAHKRQVDQIFALLVAAERRIGRAVTASEIAQESSNWRVENGGKVFEPYLVLKRLADLRDEGRVEAHEVILCPVTKRKKQTWRPLRQIKLSLVASVSEAKARSTRRELVLALRAAERFLGHADEATRVLVRNALRGEP